MKRVLIYTNEHKDPDGAYTKRVADYFAAKGVASDVIISDIRRTEDKDAEIDAFIPEDYWNLSAELTPGAKKDAFY